MYYISLLFLFLMMSCNYGSNPSRGYVISHSQTEKQENTTDNEIQKSPSAMNH